MKSHSKHKKKLFFFFLLLFSLSLTAAFVSKSELLFDLRRQAADSGGQDCYFPAAVTSTLSEYAQRKNFNVGTYLNVCFSDRSKNPSKCKKVVLKEYEGMMLAVQDQWQWSEKKRGIINSPNLDEILDFARDNGFKVHFFI